MNASYVKGVHRLVTGQYAAGHQWRFMLGQVFGSPIQEVVSLLTPFCARPTRARLL